MLDYWLRFLLKFIVEIIYITVRLVCNASYVLYIFQIFLCKRKCSSQSKNRGQLSNPAQQFPFCIIIMVSLFNVINVNEGSPHSPLKLKVWMEKGTNWNTAGGFLQLQGAAFQALFFKAATQPVLDGSGLCGIL